MDYLDYSHPIAQALPWVALRVVCLATNESSPILIVLAGLKTVEK
jgi:hypothetical protein